MNRTLRSLAPLYGAAFIVLFCGVSAVNSTIDDSSITTLSTVLLALGVVSSLWMRVQGADQRIVVWLACGIAAALFILDPNLTESLRHYLGEGSTDGVSSGGIGVVMEWATVVFSFTLLTNHSLLFAIVPSMALIGLMSSENLNPEMVTYFLGFILSTVFLMGYDAHLDRTAHAHRESGGIPIRPFIVLSSGVVAGAFLIGIVASAPLKYLGREVFSVASGRFPQTPVPYLHLTLNGSDNSMSLLGEPPNLSDAVVMRVKAPTAPLLRGAVLDRYTGDRWDNMLQPMDQEPTHDRGTPDGMNTFNLPGGEELRRLKARSPETQIVESATADQTIHAVAEPYRVDGPMERLHVDAHRTVRMDSNQAAMTYSVQSWASHATPAELRAAPSVESLLLSSGRAGYWVRHPWMEPDQNLSSIRIPGLPDLREVSLELRLPYRLQLEHVRELAQRVTRGKTNDYDRAQAVADHLRSHYTYTLDPPLLPTDADAADFFLLHSYSGYCETFASAMAVMLRTLGIPARVAGGYAPEEFDSSNGRWIVRERDAHAWVETLIPEYGWIAFDPTAGAEPEGTSLLSVRKLLNRLMRILGSRELLPTLILFSIFAVFGYVLKTEAYDRYLRSSVEEMIYRWRSGTARDPRWAVDRSYRRVRKTLRRRGVPAGPSQTPMEFQQAALEHVGDAGTRIAVPLAQLTDLYVEAAYSGRPLRPGADQASALWAERILSGLSRSAPKETASAGAPE